MAPATKQMRVGKKGAPQCSTPQLKDSFQALLLEFSNAATRGPASSLVRLFLSSTREFFQADGAYFWRVFPNGVIGEEADGHMAEQFIAAHLEADESAAVAEAIRSRKTVQVSQIQSDLDPVAARFGARSLMAAPLVTSREVIGAAVYFHVSRPDFFNDDLAAKATILAGQLGRILETDQLRARTDELHQLLEIASELVSLRDIDQLLQKFVVRAAGFLGFNRAFVGLLEDDGLCHVRWTAKNGIARALQVSIPASLAEHVAQKKEVFWTDDIRKVADIDQVRAAEFNVRQLLSVPLLASNGQSLGMFGVLDRSDNAGILPEDIRRAQALATQAAVSLETAINLKCSEEHRRDAEHLMSVALELNSLQYLPEFVQRFIARAADVMGAGSAALALSQRSQFEIAAIHAPDAIPDHLLLRSLASAIAALVSNRPQALWAGKASDLLGATIATTLNWENLILVTLQDNDGHLVGVLCLANRSLPLSQSEQLLLQTLASHASVALKKARLFTRMDDANRHWMEIFDSISDLIVVHDENYKVSRVNRSLAELVGLPPAELIGIKMAALLAESSGATTDACPFCRPGLDPADEYVHPVLERGYLVSTSRIDGPNHELTQTIHVLKDVTDRREAERRYREIFDNIQEGLYFSTPEGRFIEVNDALVRMLGYSTRDELLRVDISAQLYFASEGRKQFSSLLGKYGVLRNYEETLRRKDGAPIHTLQNVFAVRDSQGRVQQFRGLLLDITELKNSQAELQRERDFNIKILNNTQNIILVTDTAGQITYANRRWYETGAYSAQQFLGQPLAELVVPSRRNALNSGIQATLAGQQVDNLELSILRADGGVGQFSANLSPMRDEQGDVSSIVVVMTDITEAAMLHAKLMHTEKMAAVGQLVSGVAHEVNNPLTAILGFSDLLMENPDLPETAKKDLRVILQEAQRTKQIVQNLLSFARQMPPQRRAVQVNSILRRTLQLRAYDFVSHGVDIIEDFHELPEVIGDPHQLQQVFLNILNNAYDAVSETGRPARIEIETFSSNGSIEVLFRDNGNGIAAPERIFDPFFTTKEIGKGTGLGLSICYGIVREHGGEILCHNNAGREGATFIVRFPIATERVQTAAAGAMQ